MSVSQVAQSSTKMTLIMAINQNDLLVIVSKLSVTLKTNLIVVLQFTNGVNQAGIISLHLFNVYKSQQFTNWLTLCRHLSLPLDVC